MKWLDTQQIQIDPPKRPKKLTATRFATVLGLNPWTTPFEVWCEVTRTYEKPFTDTIYTLAGKAIEPKQADYMRRAYYMDLTAPADKYGEDYFKKTYGDFFPTVKTFGGMWDYLQNDDEGNPCAVLEMKTTKRAEDWKDDVPEYYALQAALYAYLLGLDNVIMVASFLESKDYDNPDEFVPSAENTIAVPFKVSERYPDFADYVARAQAWWDEYVVVGISPVYDEKRDAEVLKDLRTNFLSPATDLGELVKEAEALTAEIEAVNEAISEDKKRLEIVLGMIKDAAKGQFRDGDDKVTLRGSKYDWNVTRTLTESVDKNALKADGLFDKYATTKESYRLTRSEVKEC